MSDNREENLRDALMHSIARSLNSEEASEAEVTICRHLSSFSFQSAHHLPMLPPEHKCRRLHGHSYYLECRITGELKDGMVHGIEFDVIDALIKGLCKSFDHITLNDIPGLENPTIENMVVLLARAIKKGLGGVPVTVRLHEDKERSWAEVSV